MPRIGKTRPHTKGCWQIEWIEIMENLGQINWKHLATTPGYISLKKAYASYVVNKRSWQSKGELYRKFQWVIGRAKHYAHHTGKSIEEILNEWEEKRTYCWVNYYQNGCQPKFHSKAKKLMGVKGIRKSTKRSPFYNTEDSKHRVNDFIQTEHRKNSTKKKLRWTSERKKRGY